MIDASATWTAVDKGGLSIGLIIHCAACASEFWCPYHGENPELDDITEVEENTYLRKRVEELEVENERLKDLQVAAAFFVTCREKYQLSDISANLTDTYALGKLKQALRKSWGSNG